MSGGYCPNCGAELSPGAAFCGNCGTAVSEEAPGQTQQESPSGATATQTYAPQQQSVSAPPSGGRKSHKGLILGGLAAAGILGFMVVLILGAVIFFFATRPAETTDQPPQPSGENPGTQSPGSEDPGTQAPSGEDPAQPPPDTGSLDDIVQEQVGDFTLQQVDTLPEAVDAGAVDARQMIYASSDGTEVAHDLSVWSSPDEADQMLVSFADNLTSDGAQSVEEFEVTDQDGQQLGRGMALVGSGGEEIVLWTNDVLFCVIVAPEGYSADFYGGLSY